MRSGRGRFRRQRGCGEPGHNDLERACRIRGARVPRLIDSRRRELPAVPPPGAPISEKVPAVDWFARMVAAFCLILSGAALVYTRGKDKKARQASIEDDFWFWKVVSPAAIEPMFERLTELLAALPAIDASADALRDYSQTVTRSMLDLNGSLSLLAMLSPELPEAVRTHLEACEDLLTGYVDGLTRSAADASEPTEAVERLGPDEVRGRSWLAMSAALNEIRAKHLTRHS